MRGDGSARRHRGGSRHRPDPVRSGAVDDRSARPPGPAPRHRNRSRSCSPSPRTRAEGAADRDGVQPGRHRRPGGPPPPTRQSRRGVVTHQSHRPPPQTKRRRTHPRPDPRRRVPGPPGRRGHLPDTHQRRGQADDRPPHPHGPDRTSRRPRRLGAGRLRPRPPDSRRAPRFTLGGIGHRPRHRASDLGGHHPPPPHNHPTPLDRSHQPRLRVPGCSRPATKCHLDHTVPVSRNGKTTILNLGPLCARHHLRAKHKAGWKLAQPQPGTFCWTSPRSHQYEVRPRPP